MANITATDKKRKSTSYGSDVNAQALRMLREDAARKRQQVLAPLTQKKNAALDAYQNREDFQYDFNADALYHHYKDQYTRQGKAAMEDTMGQAAALTGGYGSSYAQNVGQQAYDAQLQNLNNVIPELYQMAYSQYQDRGNDLLRQYSLAAEEEAQAYARLNQQEQDAVADYQWQTNYNYKDKAQQESQQATEALKNPVLEKPIFSHVDKATGLYHYYLDGKSVKYEQGINPVTGTANPDGIGLNQDGSYRVFLDLNGKPGYQPNNIGGIKIEKTGVTDYINGYEQNVWRKLDDGSCWMWDDTVNTYVKYTGTKDVTSPDITATNESSNYRSVSDKLNMYISNGAPKSSISSYLRQARQAGVITPDEYNKLMKEFVPKGSTY